MVCIISLTCLDQKNKYVTYACLSLSPSSLLFVFPIDLASIIGKIVHADVVLEVGVVLHRPVGIQGVEYSIAGGQPMLARQDE